MTQPIDLSMCFRVSRDGDYGHINAYAVKIDPAKDQGFCGIMSFEHDMHDFVIRSQASRGDRGMYAWQFAIGCYDRIDLSEARRAVRLLTPIDRKMDKMTATEGNAASFGAWCNRVCRAIGVKHVFIETNAETRRATGDNFRKINIGDAVWSIDRAADELQTKLNPQLLAA